MAGTPTPPWNGFKTQRKGKGRLARQFRSSSFAAGRTSKAPQGGIQRAGQTGEATLEGRLESKQTREGQPQVLDQGWLDQGEGLELSLISCGGCSSRSVPNHLGNNQLWQQGHWCGPRWRWRPGPRWLRKRCLFKLIHIRWRVGRAFVDGGGHHGHFTSTLQLSSLPKRTLTSSVEA